MTQKNKLKRIDFSRQSTFHDCNYLYYLKYILHLIGENGSNPLRFGSTFHAMQEGLNSVLIEGGSLSDGAQVGLELGKLIWHEESSLQTFNEDYRTIENCNRAFEEYLRYHTKKKTFDNIEILHTEQYLSYDVIEWDREYQYLKPYKYEGLVDRISLIDGKLAVEDYKTTGGWLSQAGKTYAESPQLTGYAWMYWKSGGEKAYKTIHDCMHISKKVNLKLETYRFEHDISPAHYTHFETFLNNTMDIIFKCEEENYYPKNLNNCSNIFGTCEFCTFCKSDLEDYSSFGYLIKEWDPSAKSDMLHKVKENYFATNR